MLFLLVSQFHVSTKSTLYFYELILPLQMLHRYHGCFKTLGCRNELFRNSFLPFTINEWKKLDFDIKNSDSHAVFCKKLLAFIRPIGNSIYSTFSPFGVRLINRLRLGFSHLREQVRHKILKIQSISFNVATTNYLLSQQ